MLPTNRGGFRLFRFAGIDVFLHWSWLVVAVIEVQYRAATYTSMLWNAAEYLSLFAIVLLHEFGHSLACRQVGGEANEIILWPLGGVAYVSPPPRPGAVLWSLAAGPLVNVLLVPVFLLVLVVSSGMGWPTTFPDLHSLIWSVWSINLALLVFNMLPVYPLDGGQILRALLWFFIGPTRSLLVATIIGFVGVLGLGALALVAQSFWIGILAFFVALNCWRSFQHARAMMALEAAPRRSNFACPACHTAPPVGAIWACGKCREGFDPFETGTACPKCGAQFESTRCPHCGAMSPLRGVGGIGKRPDVSRRGAHHPAADHGGAFSSPRERLQSATRSGDAVTGWAVRRRP